MRNVSLRRITYGELKKKSFDLNGDDYAILSDYLNEPTQKTLLSNPNYDDDSKTAVIVVCLDDKIVGRHMLMPTKVRIGDKTILVNSGGSGEVDPKFRGKGLGTTVTRACVLDRDYADLYIGQWYSTGGLSMFQKMHATIFEQPSYYKLCKTHLILESKGVKGVALRVLSTLFDYALSVLNIPSFIKYNKLIKKYSIKQETTVPKWVEDITLQEDYENMEIHDCEWLQWCLDNNFFVDQRNYQAFYGVYDKEGNHKGFFMTKVRFEEEIGKYKNMTRGTIVEWGSVDNSELSEADLNLMAVYSFDPVVDNIITTLSDSSFDKDMKRMVFFRHGNYQMALLSDQYGESINDQSKWRIRWGGCNTILV